MQLMRDTESYYLLSERGVGVPKMYKGRCIVEENIYAQEDLDSIRKSLFEITMFPATDSASMCLSQSLDIDSPCLYSRYSNESFLRKQLLNKIWELETQNRKIPRFTYENLCEFVFDLSWEFDLAWALPDYAKSVFSTDGVTSGAILNEYVSRDSSLVKLLSAISFYKAEDRHPELSEIFLKIFERLDHKWNSNNKVAISYERVDAQDYRRAFEILGYELIKENTINRYDIIAMYRSE